MPVVSSAVLDDFIDSWSVLIPHLVPDIPAEDQDEEFSSDLEAIGRFVDSEDEEVPDIDAWNRVRSLVAKVPKDDTKVAKAVKAFETYFQWARPGVDVQQLVYKAIDGRLPTFIQFEEQHRSIQAEYVLDDASTEASVALDNLLQLAGLSLAQIRSTKDEPSHLRTLMDQANERLREFFANKWKQEKVTVGIALDGPFLRVDVQDLVQGSPGWIRITDRSDGLRTFVALATFLESENLDRPPILLIDEAEQHLHQNAQGDLIRMLQELQTVGQVIYTTHSPACLPADLGNGVRFVEPIDKGHSPIRQDFWSLARTEHVGFNPLMIAMGASAAAFSSLRSALIVEGMSDALLLPTLIRLATGRSELGYQIVSGIATASRSDMAQLDFTASRVAYLVDGDDAGCRWAAQLEDAGAPLDRIHRLPSNVGLEDLLDRQFYLDAVAELGRIDRPMLNSTPTDAPIKAAVAGMCVDESLPGPIALAEFLLGRHETGDMQITVNASLKKHLIKVDQWASRVLSTSS